MFICLQNMCAKYYELSLCFMKKNCVRQSWRVCLIQRQNSHYFAVSALEDKKLIKKQTCTKNEACKVYSGVFWIFLPNVVKIDHYNFELYRFKVCAFFLRHSVLGWMTVWWHANSLGTYPLPNHLSQLSLPSFRGRLTEYHPSLVCVHWYMASDAP